MANCEVCGARISSFAKYVFCSDLWGNQHKICMNCNDRAIREKKGFWYDSKTCRVNIVPADETQVRRLCEDCGNVFIFNCLDVYNNVQKAKLAQSHARLGLMNTLSGNYLESSLNTQNSNQLRGGIRDFNSCPQCGSRNLRDITKAEHEALQREKNNGGGNVSSADEILKYKNLLDSGIITQEEFAAKKKQLLGL